MPGRKHSARHRRRRVQRWLKHQAATRLVQGSPPDPAPAATASRPKLIRDASPERPFALVTWRARSLTMKAPSFWPTREAALTMAPGDEPWSVVNVLARPGRRIPVGEALTALLTRTRIDGLPTDNRRNGGALHDDEIIALSLAGWSDERIAVTTGMTVHGVTAAARRLRSRGRLPPLNGHQAPSSPLGATNGHPGVQ